MDKFEVFLNALNDPTRTPEELDGLARSVLTEYNLMKDKLSLDINKICFSLGRWLKSNFSSRFIPFAFRLMINLYQQLGFSLEFDVQDYYKTSDKLDEKDPKALGKSDLEGFEDDKDNLVENPLLSSEVIQVILSLVENMVSQKKHIANKNLLILVLPVLSIYSTDKRVQNIIRKKKFLKMILQIFKDIVESSQNLTEIDIQICSYLLHTTAKLTYHNKKNQDYLIKKKGYEYIKGVIATSQDLVLLQGAICTFANLAETSDGRLVLWCSGNLPFLIQRIKVALTNIKKYLSLTQRKTSTFNHALRDLELCLIALWKVSAGTDEVIEECFRNAQLMKNFEEILDLMDPITSQDPQYLSYIKCLGVCIAIIRRFCSSTKFRQPAIERFIRYIYKLPKVYGEQITYAKESHSFMLKELAGLVGVVCLDRAMIESLVSNGMVKEILKIGIAYFDSPRLIKTVLGFLTNINTVDDIRDTLSKDKEIYILLYNILDKYDYSNLIMDYAIKLILNTCQNDLFFRNYTAPRFLEKFVYIFHIYLEDDLITANMIKLFRILCSKVKSLEAFVISIKDYEAKMQNQFDFVSALVENIRIDDYQIAIDTILLISTLSQNSDVLKNKIRENKKIVAFMNAFINYYKDKPDVFKLVSSSLACLPLEELNAFL